MPYDHDVTIAGAGPVGLMLACELALRGIKVTVLEKSAEAKSPWKVMPIGMRGLNTPSVEALYRRGLLGKFFDPKDRNAALERTPFRKHGGHFAGVMIDGNKLELERWRYRIPSPSLPPGATSIEQFEQIMGDRAAELGVVIVRGSGFKSIVGEDDDGITVQAANGNEYRSRWLVGCDGGHSAVRKDAGFAFEGTEAKVTCYSTSLELENGDKLTPGFVATKHGMYIMVPNGLHLVDFDNGAYERQQEIPLEHLQEVLSRVTDTEDVIIKKIKLAASWTDRSKITSKYRVGRVLLAGDACHIHPPFGAQGLNAGLGDAVNLSWKLARTVRKEKEGDLADLGLLDTYQAERRPAAESVIEYTRAQLMAIQPDLYGRAVRNMVTALIETADGANYYLDKFWNLSQRYVPSETDCQHDLVGRSAPDFEFLDGTRLGSKLMSGKAMLLELGGKTLAGETSSGKYVDYVSAEVKDRRGLNAILIRPDGYVAWARDEPAEKDTMELQRALQKWDL